MKKQKQILSLETLNIQSFVCDLKHGQKERILAGKKAIIDNPTNPC